MQSEKGCLILKTIKPFYLDLTEDEISKLQMKLGEILRSGQLILGEYTSHFEEEFARYVGTQYAVSLNTCTSALETLLTIKLNCCRIGVKQCDDSCRRKIAVPTNTNYATVAAIIRAGSEPVFMDMNPDYFVSDLKILQDIFHRHPDTTGVMWVHIGGIISPDFEDVVLFCQENDLFLIEDCAHAHGSQLNGRKAGSYGDGGCFSFFPTKVMTTMEGGMITTDSKKVADLAKSYRNQGKRGGDYGGEHSDLGNSWRISEIAAYMGLIQLSKLDDMIVKRQKAVDLLIPALDEHGIDYCRTEHMGQASQYKFIIKYKSDISVIELKRKFREDGVIFGGGVYEKPCHLQPVFSNISHNKATLSNAEKFCPKHICPPITSGTSEEDAHYIAKEIVKYIS